MKRTIPLWLGLLAFSVLPVLAQTPSGKTGTIHGHVTNPVGTATTSGTVSLSMDEGHSSKFTFPVDSNGDYKGEATPGTYMLLYRSPETPPEKFVDSIDKVKIMIGQDTAQDIDMSRKEFIDKMSPAEKKQFEDLKAKNSAAMQANQVIKVLNADLKTVAQDIKDADGARAAAIAALGPKAAKADIDAKEAEIKTAKYTEVETLMQKDTAARPAESVLWTQLGQAQLGLRKFDEATVSFKKSLELETAAKTPNAQAQGAANSGLGEIYARTGKVPEANAAYDAAAKANPASAAVYLKNEAVIFFQMNNGDAQIAAADEAIKADPTVAIVYYLKGQGLIQKATFDAKTSKIVLPPGCAEAYQKYLDLAPTGQFAGEVKGILDQASQKVTTTFKADTKKK